MLGLIYSVVSYLVFLATFNYFALFTDGIFVPKSVDSGVANGLVLATVVNVGLLLLFGLQHSIMARAGFKRVLTRVVPAAIERATFVLASSLVLIVLMWQWRPIPAVLWHIENPIGSWLLWGLNAVGWLGVPVCSFFIDHLDLFGVKQALGAFRRVTFAQKGFGKPWLYRYVRHPMMSAMLIALWVTPHMTIGHLLLSLGMSVYIVVGVHFEERALAQTFGVEYERYQASTPKFLPIGS